MRSSCDCCTGVCFVHEIMICPMTEDCLDTVLAIEAESFPSPWSKALFEGELNSPHSFPMVAVDSAGRIVGYICPMLVIDEGHILNVAVDPHFRGQGVGRLLVERVIMDCRLQGAEFVSLEVRPSNTAAISLYRQLGFIVSGRRKAYYENGEDALMMEYIFGQDEGCDDAV
jgi:ribosomal-protein-alanine N-acetyltransferase